MISVPMRDPREDPELHALVRRYVLPGRRYLKLGGPLLRMEEGEYGRFLRALREDAGAVTAEEIGVLLEGGGGSGGPPLGWWLWVGGPSSGSGSGACCGRVRCAVPGPRMP